MGLRAQLLIVSLLTLALPWAGCQYVQEMESALRTDHEAALYDSTLALARVISDRPELLYPSAAALDASHNHDADLFAHALQGPVAVDGYPDDWGAAADALIRYPPRDGEPATLSVDAVIGHDERYVYLFVAVADDLVRYLDTSRGPLHDRLILTAWNDADEAIELSIETRAPGPLQGRREDAAGNVTEPGVIGHWQPNTRGYQVELRVPRTLAGTRFGFVVVDGDETPRDPPTTAGSVTLDQPVPGLLLRRRDALVAAIADFAGPQRRLAVSSPAGWPLAQSGSLSAALPVAETRGLIADLYRLLLDPALPELLRRDLQGRLQGTDVTSAAAGVGTTQWYRAPASGRAIVAASAPIEYAGRVIGVVTLEQPSVAILTLTNRALTRLVTLTTLATLIAAAGLLGFATWLSLRIRRLRDAAEGALSSDGRIRAAAVIPGIRAHDELGDLSRSFDTLLGQLRQHTDYLRSLAGKLSHELRTPLAVVQSSLENLESTGLGDDAQVYARRAHDGAARLRSILTAMSEAARVEQSIEGAERETFDLAALLASMSQSYQDTYPDRAFGYRGPSSGQPLCGAPELLVQMLDKLVENAVDFTTVGGNIELSLSTTTTPARAYRIAVSNEGAPLPAAMQDSLFGSLVSLREHDSDRPHLGFGLFIARLIVEFHGGRIRAQDLPADGGVEFVIELPGDAPTDSG